MHSGRCPAPAAGARRGCVRAAHSALFCKKTFCKRMSCRKMSCRKMSCKLMSLQCDLDSAAQCFVCRLAEGAEGGIVNGIHDLREQLRISLNVQLGSVQAIAHLYAAELRVQVNIGGELSIGARGHLVLEDLAFTV